MQIEKSNLVFSPLLSSVTGGILWLLVRYHPLCLRNPEETRTVGIYDPKIVVWQAFGALMQQGKEGCHGFFSHTDGVNGLWPCVSLNHAKTL